jgi:hypothetical protein
VASLEGLVEATRDIFHIDRSDIYYHLLLSYCKLNTYEVSKILVKRVGQDERSDESIRCLVVSDVKVKKK